MSSSSWLGKCQVELSLCRPKCFLILLVLPGILVTGSASRVKSSSSFRSEFSSTLAPIYFFRGVFAQVEHCCCIRGLALGVNIKGDTVWNRKKERKGSHVREIHHKYLIKMNKPNMYQLFIPHGFRASLAWRRGRAPSKATLIYQDMATERIFQTFPFEKYTMTLNIIEVDTSRIQI